MRDTRGRLARSLLLALAVTRLIWPAVAEASAGGRPLEPQASQNLLDAAKTGDVAAVDALLEQDVDATSAEPDGTTALHWAARADALDIVERLLAAGADATAANRYGVTPLSLAAENGSDAIVRVLLSAGADANTATPQGETVLMVAARTGRVDVVRRLLAGGAAVDRTETWRGQTALMWAAAENNTDAINALVAAGADVEARSTRDLTPLLFAIREGQTDAVQALLAAGADVNADVNDTSPLVLAIINAHYALGRVLLEAGANSNAPDARGSALHALAWMRRPGSGRPPIQTGELDSLTLAEAMLERGADPNAQIAWKEIPFEVDLGTVKSPPNISVGRNFVSFVGATPFYLAAKHADVELMQLLVEDGANPLTPTGQGVTPLMAAAGLGFWDGESPGPLNGTPDSVRLDAVKLTLELGNDLDAVTDFGDTEIEGDGVTLLLRHPLNLLELDAQKDRGDMRWGGCTALHGAAMMGSNLIVQYLIDLGADINAQNGLGWTPLMTAEGVFVANTEKAWPETAALLRALGARASPSR